MYPIKDQTVMSFPKTAGLVNAPIILATYPNDTVEKHPMIVV